MKIKEFSLLLKMLTIGLLLFMFSSCASIIKGGDQVMNIKTDPAQAKCVISNLRSGQEVANVTTPSATILKKGDGYFSKGSYKISCEKEGYEKKDVSLEGNLSGCYIGNIVFGGLIGWFIVDPITGAMWNLEPENVDLTLSKKGEAPQPVGAVIKNMDAPQIPLQPVKAAVPPAATTSTQEPRAIFIK
jgi:hypothetical protein